LAGAIPWTAVQSSLGVAKQDFTHFDRKAGASLEYLGGRKLPGVEALTNK